MKTKIKKKISPRKVADSTSVEESVRKTILVDRELLEASLRVGHEVRRSFSDLVREGLLNNRLIKQEIKRRKGGSDGYAG